MFISWAQQIGQVILQNEYPFTGCVTIRCTNNDNSFRLHLVSTLFRPKEKIDLPMYVVSRKEGKHQVQTFSI